MKNYDNVYIAKETIKVDNNENILTIYSGEQLELQNIYTEKNQRLFQFVYNGRVIYVEENIVKEEFKTAMNLYQEQFSHLDKNNLYFGQIRKGETFSIEEDETTRYYLKIGEYITGNGDKYNAVEGDSYSLYFDPTGIEDFERLQLTYFNPDDLI